jgi:hypothetical protein
MVFDGVVHGDLAHGARAFVVKGAEAALELLRHTPAFAAVPT